MLIYIVFLNSNLIFLHLVVTFLEVWVGYCVIESMQADVKLTDRWPRTLRLRVEEERQSAQGTSRETDVRS